MAIIRAMKTIGKQRLALLLAVLLLESAAIHQADAEGASVTESTFHLTLDAPISTWDEAIPLGNGMLGGLLWGTDNKINLSLDRGDLWDETTPPEIKEGNWNYANMKKLVQENFGEFMRRYDGTYNHPAPTKIPGGRLVLTLNPANQAKSFVLDLVKYFYGAASRPEAPSMPLQAVWTQDSGGLPPWKGDFHHDLNTQMTYLAYHKAGLVDSGMSFINHMWDLMPEYRKFAQEFFGVEGAAVPCVMTLNGKPLGGWPQYTLSPSYAIWIGQSFYLHWKHTMDRAFLRDKAYPWMDEIVSTIVRLLEEKEGNLYLPLSSSSEIFDASPRAFLKPNSNQDLTMLQWAFDAMAEMAGALGKERDVAKWRTLRSKLDDLHVEENILMFSSNEPFNQSHRHHAHTMAIHPFATLNIDGTEKDRKIIAATLEKMDKLGTRAWTGYSFS